MEIQGYPDYLIYDDGRIYSRKRNGWKGGFIQPKPSKHGYLRIALSDGTYKPKKYSIHRLVAEHYLPNIENKPQVDHIDRDKTNNHVSNLRWVTQEENNQNRGINSRNTSGHKNIVYFKRTNRWDYCRVFNTKKDNRIEIKRRFKSKIDALCYKYIMLLRIKAKHHLKPNFHLKDRSMENIHWDSHGKSWVYKRLVNGKYIKKQSKNKLDVICYKYIHNLRIKAGHYQ
jgi:hypothetical protein